MTDIKFKAISINEKQWVESMTVSKGIIRRKSTCYFLEISPNVWKGVITETICQSTGLKDVDGNDYFNGDIPEQNEPIQYRDGCFFTGHIPLALVAEHRKIIGNIHDHLIG